MKNLRNYLNYIPESLTAYIDRYDLSMTNNELIDLIINDDWTTYLFGRNYNSIKIINIIFDVKFIPEYAKYYDELCKIIVKNNSFNIYFINPEYCKNYDELCKIYIEYNSYNIDLIDPKYCTIYNELCRISVENDRNNIKYINPKYCTIYDELKNFIG